MKTMKKICVDCQKPFMVDKTKTWAIRCYPCWQVINERQGKQRVAQLEQQVQRLRQQVMRGGGDPDQVDQLEAENAALKVERLNLQRRLLVLERQATLQGLHRQHASGPIPSEMLKRLIMLCHPDRHQGSEMSTQMTQWLLEQR